MAAEVRRILTVANSNDFDSEASLQARRVQTFERLLLEASESLTGMDGTESRDHWLLQDVAELVRRRDDTEFYDEIDSMLTRISS